MKCTSIIFLSAFKFQYVEVMGNIYEMTLDIYISFTD